MKILYFDVETTGLHCVKQDIIQLAFLVEIDDKLVEKGNIKMQPFDYETVEQKALEVNKTTIKMLKTYQPPQEAYKEFITVLGKYVDKYNPEDKFFPAGYNVQFDMGFLKQFFIKNEDKYFGSWFNYKMLDPLPLLYLLHVKGVIDFKKYTLEEVCSQLKIDLDAHDALSDVEATREVFCRLWKRIKL